MKSATVLALALLPCLAQAQALSPADKAWIARCAQRLTGGEHVPAPAAAIYCACMHEQVEDNADMTQTQMERSWPPMHLYCRKKSGRG